MDLRCTAFSARLAVLMCRGDESGTGTLARMFVRGNGAAQPEHELLGLARTLVTAFQPGVLEAVLAGYERAFGGQLDGGDD